MEFTACLSAGNCQCVQNFTLPGFGLPQISVEVDFNHTMCITCNQRMFSLTQNNNNPTILDNSTFGVTILTMVAPVKYVLLLHNPQAVLSSNVPTAIACGGESYRISELSTCLKFYLHYSVHLVSLLL